MNVLFLIDTLAVGGAERSLLEILPRLQHTVPVICHLYPPDTLKPEYESAGVPVISLNIPGKYHFGTAIRKVARLVRQRRPDLLHTTLFRSDVVGRCAGRIAGVPVISSFVNDSYHPERKRRLTAIGRSKLAAVQLLDALTAHMADHFVAVSASCKTANCRDLHIAEDKVSVIYRGRNVEDLAATNPAAVRAELLLRDGQPLILAVGRLLLRKGHEDLIRAMPTVFEGFPEARLAIAGAGHDRDILQAAVDALGLRERVSFLGIRNDIPALLQAADLFAFPSHYEGHPGALVEAMLAARPIVASDIPVHREMIRHDETGLLTAVADPPSLAASICALLRDRDRACRLGDAARVEAVERFDIRLIARQYDALYAERMRLKARSP